MPHGSRGGVITSVDGSRAGKGAATVSSGAKAPGAANAAGAPAAGGGSGVAIGAAAGAAAGVAVLIAAVAAAVVIRRRRSAGSVMVPASEANASAALQATMAVDAPEEQGDAGVQIEDAPDAAVSAALHVVNKPGFGQQYARLDGAAAAAEGGQAEGSGRGGSA